MIDWLPKRTHIAASHLRRHVTVEPTGQPIEQAERLDLGNCWLGTQSIPGAWILSPIRIEVRTFAAPARLAPAFSRCR